MTDGTLRPSVGRGRVPLTVALALILINVFWAAAAAAAKLAFGGSAGHAPTGIGPCTLACVRFAPAALILYVCLRLGRRWVPVRREDRGAFLAVGVLGIALTYTVFYGGMRLTSATETTLLFAAEPILLVVMAHFMLHDRIAGVRRLGLFLGFAGVYVVVVEGIVPRFVGSALGHTLGNAVVTASLCFECYAGIVTKRLTARYPGLVIVTVQMAIGAAALFPLAALEFARHRPHHLDAAAIGGIVYLALVCSALSYGIWYVVMESQPLSSMAGFLFVQPVMAPVFGYWLQGERLRLWTAIGALLVMIGVWLVAAPPARCGQLRGNRGD